jgi:hypothetical protein
MPRAQALTAALVAASSIALIAQAPASAAPAAVSTTQLVGSASCFGGGHIRLVTSIDQAGTAQAVATVRGVKAKRWLGEVVAGVDESVAADMTSQTALASMKSFVTKHGRFTETQTRIDATTADSLAFFEGMGSGRRSASEECGAMVVSRGNTYVTADVLGKEGLAVVAGPASAVDASIAGTKGDRYRATFTVVGRSGAARRFSAEKAATERGVLDIVVRHVRRLGAFATASVRVVDLTDHTVQPMTYSIGR